MLAGFAHFRRDAVGAVDHPFPIWDFFHAIDKNGALALQFLDHKAVVDNFLADVDGRAEGLQGDADNVNGPYHSRAEAAGLKQKQRLFVLIVPPYSAFLGYTSPMGG